MIPALIVAGLVLLVLSQRRLSSSIMDTLKITKPAPAVLGEIQLAWLHWREVRAMLKYGREVKTAAAVAAAFRAAGLSQFFQSAGYCWRALAAISLHETGYGTSHAAWEHDNLWGVSYDALLGPGEAMVPYAYVSMAHATEHLMKVLNMSRYAGARAVKSDGRAFLAALNEAGYNSSAAWRRGVLAAYSQLEIV